MLYMAEKQKKKKKKKIPMNYFYLGLLVILYIYIKILEFLENSKKALHGLYNLMWCLTWEREKKFGSTYICVHLNLIDAF